MRDVATVMQRMEMIRRITSEITEYLEELGSEGRLLALQVEDRQSSVAGLGQRGAQHLGVDAVELGVQLQGRDEVTGTGNLEVHVAEAILGAQDVGQGDGLELS